MHLLNVQGSLCKKVSDRRVHICWSELSVILAAPFDYSFIFQLIPVLKIQNQLKKQTNKKNYIYCKTRFVYLLSGFLFLKIWQTIKTRKCGSNIRGLATCEALKVVRFITSLLIHPAGGDAREHRGRKGSEDGGEKKFSGKILKKRPKMK